MKFKIEIQDVDGTDFYVLYQRQWFRWVVVSYHATPEACKKLARDLKRVWTGRCTYEVFTL